MAENLPTQSSAAQTRTLGKTQTDKSHQFFKDTRVGSCSHVVVKNGVAEAVPFRPAPHKDTSGKAHYTTSFNQ